MTVDVYTFASSSLVNVWAGVGAQMWAVPELPNTQTNESRATKAAKMPLGAFGLLYSSKDKCFTSPFVVVGKSNPTAVVTHIWEGRWILPFAIRTLGDPHRRLGWDEAKKALPSCVGGRALKELIHVEPLTVFAASKLEEADWAKLMEVLAS